MHILHKLLYSTKGKTNTGTILMIVVLLGAAYYLYTTGALDGLLGGLSIEGGETSGMVDVNKKLQFTWTDEWAGSVANAKTFYLYDDSKALRETLTTAATGIVASSQNYPSGTHLYVKFVDGNDKIWYDFTVPKMNVHDSESNTYNDVAFKDFEVGTYTTDRLIMEGLTVSDGEQINATGNATTTPSFIYTLTNTGADNTGIIDSYDPLYDEAWQTWVTGTITGNNYSLVIVQGADYLWESGSTIYFAKRMSSDALSTEVIGIDKVPPHLGTDTVSFSLDLTGFTATSAATMQLTVYAYADPAYAMAHAGNYGHSEYTIAEQTVTIVDI